jgi:hypothetical protein
VRDDVAVVVVVAALCIALLIATWFAERGHGR